VKAIVLLLLVVLTVILTLIGVLAFHESFKLLEESSNYPLFIINDTSVDVGLRFYYWFRSAVLLLIACIVVFIVSVFVAVIVYVLMVWCNGKRAVY
jgi:hypothetical protein